MDRQTKVYQIGLLFQTSEFWFYVETLCKPYQNLVQRLLVLEKYTSLVFFMVCLPSGSAGFKARAQPHNPDRSATTTTTTTTVLLCFVVHTKMCGDMPNRMYPAARRLAASQVLPTVEPILVGIKIDKAHEAELVQTQDHRIKSKTMKQHRNCI
jgi:hypothetical protein